MPENAKTIRLLILNASQNEAEELVNLLRNAGRATQGQLVESMEHLTELLNRRSWDLCLAAMNIENLSPFDLSSQIKKLEQDIPVILLTQDEHQDNLLKALKAGMRDAVPSGQPEQLQLVALRELDNLYARRQQRKAEIALREAEKRCRLLLDSSRDAIAYLHDGMHIYANNVYVKMFGYGEFDDLEGLPAMDLVAADDQAAFKVFLKSFTDNSAATHEYSYRAAREDGLYFDVTMRLSSAQYDGESCIQVVVRPVEQVQEELTAPTTQDAVTGLRNLASFNEQVDKAIEKAHATKQKYAVLCIQPDKITELASGIDAAGMNMLLGDIAHALQNVIKPPHLLASTGDTEFAALLTNCEAQTAETLAQQACDAVAQLTTQVKEQTLNTTVSIGISILNENTANPEEIIAKAREAAEFVIAHSEAGNGVHLHSTDEQYEVNARKVLQLLQRALNDQLFTLLYQPIISLRGDSAEHYEALLRMPDEEGNIISPSRFLQTASDSGLIRQIERWAIETSIRALTQHISKGHKTHLFINITAESMRDPQLVPWLGKLLNELRLPGDWIIFQISETDAMAHNDQVCEFITQITSLQCRTALTNFGRALNPFQTIKKVPVNYIKIDSSYITELGKDDEAKEELKTLISSLHAQGKLTIAPMVDNAGLLPVLWQAGVNYIQGYYIQQPGDTMDYDFSAEDEEEML